MTGSAASSDFENHAAKQRYNEKKFPGEQRLRMKTFSASLILSLTMAAWMGYAQTAPKLLADIPFSYQAGGKTLPAGLYEFQVNADAPGITVTGSQTKEAVSVRSRARRPPRPGGQPAIVFDKVGDQHFLSEFYTATTGFILAGGAPGEHTHVNIKPRS
jgi:hypothetical protein